MAEQHLAEVLVLASEEPEQQRVQLHGTQLPLIPEQNERLHQTSAQSWVQHCIVCVQQLHDLLSEALSLFWIALADLQKQEPGSEPQSHFAHCRKGKGIQEGSRQERSSTGRGTCLSYEVHKLCELTGLFARLQGEDLQRSFVVAELHIHHLSGTPKQPLNKRTSQ